MIYTHIPAITQISLYFLLLSSLASIDAQVHNIGQMVEKIAARMMIANNRDKMIPAFPPKTLFASSRLGMEACTAA